MTNTSTPDTSPTGKVHITRTPVGDRSLDDLQALAFQEPMWLEAPDGDLVVFIQFVSRRLSLKHWSHQDHSLFIASTFAELAAFMQGQEGMGQLLDPEERTPFRDWQCAVPSVDLDSVPSEGN